MNLHEVGDDGGDAPIEDIAFLTRSPHRVHALLALTERPRSRAELCERTAVSSSTIRRTLHEFETRTWARKDGYQYVATRLGEAIATELTELVALVETERKLRDIWHWLPDAVTDAPFETWSEMRVTLSDPDAPYRPVNRFRTLLQHTDEVRYLRPEVALMEPCLDTLPTLVDDGTTMTLIDRPSCHAYFLQTYPERSQALEQHRNFTVLAHDDLPRCGVGLLDARVTISCYGDDSGSVHALLETDHPSIRDWAESIFATCVREATPVDPDEYLS